MKHTGSYQAELNCLLGVADQALKTVLTSNDAKRKHPAFSYRSEDMMEHLSKSLGHIITHIKISNGYCPADGESHLHNALARLVMAIAKMEEKQNG